MLKSAPNPQDVLDLQFKLRSRLKIFDNKETTPFSKNCNLIAAASRFGLIFVGTPSSNFQVLQAETLSEWSKNDEDKSDYPYREVLLPSPPKFLSVNCEHTILAVVVEKNACPVVQFYDVRSFWTRNIIQLEEARLSPTPEVSILQVDWNPTIGPIFTACKSDGSLGVYELKNPGIDINELPAAAGATSFCWSPKGKQIAVGSRDGRITQYKPDLKAVKMINAPPLNEPHLLLSLQWVSNYQFVGAYQPLNPDGMASVIVVDAPKTGEPVYTNYDAICYSNGTVRTPQLYMIFQQHWNVLMVASSNSSEVGVLGLGGDAWTQWIMADAARAELPLSADYKDTLPVGLELDISSTRPIIWGDSSLPPAPILLMLSHYGTLCCFDVVNLKEGAPTVCTPPDPISDKTGLESFTVKSAVMKKEPPVKPEPVEVPKTPTVVPLNIPKVVSFSTPPNISNVTPSLFAPKPQQPTQAPSHSILSLLSAPSKIAPPVSSAPLNFAAEIKPVVAQPPQKLPELQPLQEVVKSEPIGEVKDDAETEAIFSRMVKEECVFLEGELKALLHQGGTLKIDLGTDDDKTRLVQTASSLEEFFKEIVDISSGQSSEVHGLKQSLFQSWAWFDEAKTAHLAGSDETMSIILRAQPLDSATEKQLDDIRHSIYYLESQLSQASRALDEQWDKFQSFCRKTHKVQMPTMEAIFQTLVKQTAVVKKQSYILQDIGNRIKGRSRPSALGPSLLLSIENADDLAEELRRLRLNPKDVCVMQYRHITDRSKCLTKKKSESLRNFLKNRDFPHISVNKPQLSSSILTVASSPSSTRSRLSVLEAKFSPVVADNKAPVTGRKLEFVQSTPKVEPKKPDGFATNTPIESLQKFADKFEPGNLTPIKNVPAFGSKILPSGPNSAFVSTTFGASTPVTSLAVSKPSFGGIPATTTVKTQNFSFGPVLTTMTLSNNQPVITISASNPAAIKKPLQFGDTHPEISITPLPKSTTALSGGKSLFGGPASGNKPIFGSPAQQTAVTSIPSPPVAVTKAMTVATSTPTSTAAMFSFAKPMATSTVSTATTVTTVTKPFSIFANASSSGVSSGASLFGGAVATTPSGESSSEGKFSFVPKVATTAPPLAKSQPVSFTTTPATSVAPKATITTAAPAVRQPSPVVATAASKPSIFGAFAATAASSSSIFGGTTSIFASDNAKPVTTTSISQSPTQTGVSSSPVVTKPISTFVPVQGSAFGGSSGSEGLVKPMFGALTTTASVPVDNATPSSSIFGSTASEAPLFGVATTSTPTTTTATVFGAFTPESAAKPPVFGTPVVTTVQSTQAIFGGATASTTATGGTNTQSIFGGAVSTTSQPSSIFGGAAPQPAIFGEAQTSSIFKAPVTSTNAAFSSPVSAASPFGAAPAFAGAAAPFGAVTTGATSPFGFAQSSTSGSVFGQQSAPFGTTAGAAFASPPQGVFGAPSTTGFSFGQPQPNGGSIFANAATTSSGSIFGAPTTVMSTTGFGSQGASSVFGAAPAASSSPFGAVSSQPSSFSFASAAAANNAGGGAFGFGGLNVGPTTTTSSFGFSQSAAPPNNPFGGDSKSIFGSSSATPSSGSIFGPNSGSSGAFGSSSAFGGGTSTFGSFGQPQQQQVSSTFGQGSFGGASTFGSPQPGPFSGGAGSVSQSGFGSSPSFQKTPSGFGASTAFGATPPPSSAFGATPSFGGAPAFGSVPAFGSPAKVFGGGGGGSPGGGFGSPGNVQSSSFGNLANQPTVGFGNLAQQASTGQSGNAPFSGNTSFSSWR